VHDLDLPEVIQLRRDLLGDDDGRYHLLGCSVLEDAWLEAVNVHAGRPVLFLAENVWGFFDRPEPRMDSIRWLAPFFRLFKPMRIFQFRLGEALG
jgi:O-methyltransferase involved in polyketide biosynthesis